MYHHHLPKTVCLVSRFLIKKFRFYFLLFYIINFNSLTLQKKNKISTTAKTNRKTYFPIAKKKSVKVTKALFTLIK
jgi:hypothetical protein